MSQPGPKHNGSAYSVTGVTPVAASHYEADLGWLAAVTDRGHRHPRNEDAFAILSKHDRAVIIVCDGVSTSENPDQAATTAANVGLEAISGLLDTGWASKEQPRQTLHDALVAAQSAVAELAIHSAVAVAKPPATTILAALVTPGEAFLAGFGDSRAYWITTETATQLTTDDSWAQEAINAGIAEPEARRSPYAHAITRWLGATAESTSPVVHAVRLAGPGTLIICTDGLWNSYPHANDLADLINRTATTASAITTARSIVSAALNAGGHDNVTGAVAQMRADDPAPRSAGRNEAPRKPDHGNILRVGL